MPSTRGEFPIQRLVGERLLLLGGRCAASATFGSGLAASVSSSAAALAGSDFSSRSSRRTCKAFALGSSGWRAMKSVSRASRAAACAGVSMRSRWSRCWKITVRSAFCLTTRARPARRGFRRGVLPAVEHRAAFGGRGGELHGFQLQQFRVPAVRVVGEILGERGGGVVQFAFDGRGELHLVDALRRIRRELLAKLFDVRPIWSAVGRHRRSVERRSRTGEQNQPPDGVHGASRNFHGLRIGPDNPSSSAAERESTTEFNQKARCHSTNHAKRRTSLGGKKVMFSEGVWPRKR